MATDIKADSEPHAFGSFIPLGSEILIVGTFPTHFNNRDFDFYYPNRNNVFWKILGSIYEYSFINAAGSKAVEERKALVTKHKIALTDMMAKAIRVDDSSSDDKLILVEMMDIHSILISCPTLKRVVLTSRSGRINARQLFETHLSEKKVPILYTANVGNIIKGHFNLSSRKIEVQIPYSPSPRVVRRFGFDAICEMYMQSLVS